MNTSKRHSATRSQEHGKKPLHCTVSVQAATIGYLGDNVMFSAGCDCAISPMPVPPNQERPGRRVNSRK